MAGQHAHPESLPIIRVIAPANGRGGSSDDLRPARRGLDNNLTSRANGALTAADGALTFTGELFGDELLATVSDR
jgi:hypothetical protein